MRRRRFIQGLASLPLLVALRWSGASAWPGEQLGTAPEEEIGDLIQHVWQQGGTPQRVYAGPHGRAVIDWVEDRLDGQVDASWAKNQYASRPRS